MLTGTINITTDEIIVARAMADMLAGDSSTTITLHGDLVDLDGDPIFAASGVQVLAIGRSRVTIKVDGERDEVRVSSLPANARWEITRR